MADVNEPLPQWVQSLSARERSLWIAAERVYTTVIGYHPGEERTMTPFRELIPDVQLAVAGAALPLIQALHGVGLNEAARTPTPEGKANDNA